MNNEELIMNNEKSHEKINKTNATPVGARLEGIPVRHDTTVPEKSNKTKATPVGAAWHAAHEKTTHGITLIALIITIIVMLILAGIVLSLTIGERGIFKTAVESAENMEEAEAREKLELVLLDLQADKVTDTNYNENEYINTKIQVNEMVVDGDIVFVNGWQFQIDRSVPEIVANLGKGQPEEKIQIEMTSTTSSDYAKATINIEITYEKEIVSILLNGENIEIPEKQDGKYVIEEDVTSNGIYTVIAKDAEDKYNTKSIKISDVADNMNIYTVEDLVKFRDKVNSGATFEGKTVNLMNDLDLNTSEQYDFDEDGKITFKETATKCKPIGSTDKPYKGIFNGNNHTISGLYINETNEKAVGLFGMVAQNAEIKNTIISDSYISGNYVGGIAGYNEGKIYRCKTQRVTIENTMWAGGIVGVNNGEIVECATILLYANVDTIGGIAGGNGENDGRDGFTHNTTIGKIYRCYSTGYIKYAEVGGIVSHNGVYGGEGYIYDCYSTAKMEDNMYKGAIVSVQSYSGRGGYIYNSYYLNLDCSNFSSVATPEHYGKVSNSYANDTSVTAEKLNSGSSDNVWTNDIQNKDGTWKYNNGYPILKWQLEE